MAEYQRPPGWRFEYLGMDLRSSPDSIPPTKYQLAQNVRGYSKTAIRARPGYNPLFATNNNPITDVRAYAAIETDDLPRWIARDNTNAIFLDSSGNNAVVTLAAPVGSGVSLVPFRPSASPQAWMYVSGPGDYQKISAPNSNNNVTVQKVGIPEPQHQVEFAPQSLDYTAFTNNANNWVAG